MKRHGRWAVPMGLVTAMLTLAHAQQGTSACGEISGGAVDYRVPSSYLKTIESAHFTAEVEALIRGKSGSLAQEIAFVLDAVPNHHRALVSVMRLGQRLKTPQPAGMRYSVECYFDRALRFAPKDDIARLLFASFLAGQQRAPEAFAQLERVGATADDNAFTHYNIGLIYFDLRQFDQAEIYARRAMELGFPRTELRDRLKAAGHWKSDDGTTGKEPSTGGEAAPASGSGQ